MQSGDAGSGRTQDSHAQAGVAANLPAPGPGWGHPGKSRTRHPGNTPPARCSGPAFGWLQFILAGCSAASCGRIGAVGPRRHSAKPSKPLPRPNEPAPGPVRRSAAQWPQFPADSCPWPSEPVPCPSRHKPPAGRVPPHTQHNTHLLLLPPPPPRPPGAARGAGAAAMANPLVQRCGARPRARLPPRLLLLRPRAGRTHISRRRAVLPGRPPRQRGRGRGRPGRPRPSGAREAPSSPATAAGENPGPGTAPGPPALGPGVPLPASERPPRAGRPARLNLTGLHVPSRSRTGAVPPPLVFFRAARAHPRTGLLWWFWSPHLPQRQPRSAARGISEPRLRRP